MILGAAMFVGLVILAIYLAGRWNILPSSVKQ
jgi:hypothetical protein